MLHGEMVERLKKGENPLPLSIEKWQDVVDGKGPDDGADNCALCYVNKKHCRGCIIFKHTGQSHCYGTPFREIHDFMDTPYSGTNATYRRKIKQFQKKELEFLKSLLPKK